MTRRRQSLPELLGISTGAIRSALETMAASMRVAVPGIIQAFDADAQTVTVQVSIRERINLSGNLTWESIPLLVDVPIFMPRAGGFTLTMPVAAGDECLVIFGDNCIDAWWQSGGVQNQVEKRRHDLSDGFAIVGIWSQPRVLDGYKTDAAQLRNDAGDVYVEIDSQGKARIQAVDMEFHASHSMSWDVDGYGKRITSLGPPDYEIHTWQNGAVITSVTDNIDPPEGPP
jgi:hypothetical protein